MEQESVFIRKLHIHKVRHLSDIDIDLSDTERKHLIITGKNGSGKTSLLEALKEIISQETQYARDSRHVRPAADVSVLTVSYEALKRIRKGVLPVSIFLNAEVDYDSFCERSLFAYIPAHRQLRPELPKAIEKVEINDKLSIKTSASQQFLKMILHFDYQLLSAARNKEAETEKNLTQWFAALQKALSDIYQYPELEGQVDAKNLTYTIRIPGHEPFGLNEMSDGYAAFLDIVMELVMRMDGGGGVVNYRQPGFVLIDEIETHLHVDLQKKVLPFLTKLFPHIQFIVTTHSPFVITSLPNAVVFDLETRRRLEDPQRYSYESIIEAYFDADMYAETMKNTFNRYKELLFKTDRTPEEQKEFLRVKAELELVPPASKELYEAFRVLEDQRKAGGHGQN